MGGGERDVEWGEIGGTLSGKTVSPERPLAPMRVWRIAFVYVWCGGACLRAADEPAKAPGGNAPAAQPLPGIFAPKLPSKKASSPRRAGAPSSAPTRRAMSPEMAAKLSEVVKQATPPPSSGERRASAEAEGGSDAVQLEPFVVEEEKYPEFKEREILTRKGKLAEGVSGRFPWGTTGWRARCWKTSSGGSGSRRCRNCRDCWRSGRWRCRARGAEGDERNAHAGNAPEGRTAFSRPGEEMKKAGSRTNPPEVNLFPRSATFADRSSP